MDLLNFYNESTKKYTGYTLSRNEISQLSDALSRLSLENAYQVSLILLHHFKVSGVSLTSLSQKTNPYGIRISPGKGYSIELDILPSVLTHVLKEYCGI